MSKELFITDKTVLTKIYLVRGQKVMMDRDLAEMYGVKTKILNQAVKRHQKRFPEDFMFQLRSKELKEWKSQIAVSSKERMGLRKLPLAFTEQGVAMLSSVLNSETAIEVNIRIIRVFSRIREMLLAHKDTLLKLEQIQQKILRHNGRLNKHDREMRAVFAALKELIITKHQTTRRIGFKLGDVNNVSSKEHPSASSHGAMPI